LRSGADRLASIATMGAASALMALPLALLLPAPAREAWPFLALSATLQIAYCVALVRAYDAGDLAQVYPIARGSSPLLVTVGAAVVVDERLGALALAGVALVSAGIAGVAFGRARRPPSSSALAAALVTGALIASYTVVDGMGARASGAPLSYAACLFVLQGAPMPLVYLALRRRLPTFASSKKAAAKDAAKGVGAALASSAAYGSVVWALAASPMGATSALRETSVLFAALLGRFALGEELTRARVVSCVAIAAGAVCLGWSR
jgi:drug/metabolite transporter (DMT)-like permease